MTSSALIREGVEAALAFIPHESRCFITIDFDVLDPSVMPAVGAPTPGGLDYLEVIELIRAVDTKNTGGWSLPGGICP